LTITINTDASFHPKHKVGAFAFWIVWDGGRMVQSGPLRNVQSSLDAELQAIGNALYAVLKSEIIGIKHIYVNTDCKFGIEAINKKRKVWEAPETVPKIRSIIQKLKGKNRWSMEMAKGTRFKDFISFRYVKAHTTGSSPRSWVNNKMDEMAKAALWKCINNK
jgi:ribonuclease HI